MHASPKRMHVFTTWSGGALAYDPTWSRMSHSLSMSIAFFVVSSLTARRMGPPQHVAWREKEVEAGEGKREREKGSLAGERDIVRGEGGKRGREEVE
eukprot:5093077-Pleurochrysis_carterae.AAC.2